MALTRKFLSAMGIEDAKIDEIINAHTDVTNALKKERDDFQEKAEKLDSVQKQLDMANEKLKQFEDSSNDSEAWKKKYEKESEDKKKLQKDFEDYKQGIKDKETLEQKQNAYKQLLKEAGVSEKRIDSVLKVSNISAIEFDDDNKIKDSDKLIENVKNEWADFIVTEGQQGAKTANPPQNNGGNQSSASVASQRVADFYKNRYGTKED